MRMLGADAGDSRRAGARDQPARRALTLHRTGDAQRTCAQPDGGAMRILRTRPPRGPPARHGGDRADGQPEPVALPERALRRAGRERLAQLRRRSARRSRGLQVRMPLSCQNTRTHRRSAPTLAFGARGRGPHHVLPHLPAGRRQRERLVRRRRQQPPARDLPLAAAARRHRARQRARPQPGRARDLLGRARASTSAPR